MVGWCLQFIPWKFGLEILIEEAKICEPVEKEIAALAYVTKLVDQNKEAKAKRIILDSM